MKRRLNTLKGKKLVTGDPNLMTKDEICINATPNGVEVKEIGTDGKIKDLAGSSGSSSESTKGFQYKSSKVCWKIDPKTEEQKAMSIGVLGELLVIPLYSALLITYDGDYSNYVKYYANFTYTPLVKYCGQEDPHDLYIEENIFTDPYNLGGTIIENISILKVLEVLNVSEEQLYEMTGIKRIPYEEYINLRVDTEIGKELVNE